MDYGSYGGGWESEGSLLLAGVRGSQRVAPLPDVTLSTTPDTVDCFEIFMWSTRTNRTLFHCLTNERTNTTNDIIEATDELDCSATFLLPPHIRDIGDNREPISESISEVFVHRSPLIGPRADPAPFTDPSSFLFSTHFQIIKRQK
ncbi:hypothetical protein CBL_05982 [Carabus blaptoides fortunei]